jgi:hypothetical protein
MAHQTSPQNTAGQLAANAATVRERQSPGMKTWLRSMNTIAAVIGLLYLFLV